MHYLPLFLKTTLYKRDNFFFWFVFFLETKLYMWTILTSKCVVMPFFVISELCYGRDVQWLQQYIGHYGLYHTELAMDSVTLTVCDKCGSIADQNVTVFQYYEDEKL